MKKISELEECWSKEDLRALLRSKGVADALCEQLAETQHLMMRYFVQAGRCDALNSLYEQAVDAGQDEPADMFAALYSAERLKLNKRFDALNDYAGGVINKLDGRLN